jgi:hypothetical protein
VRREVISRGGHSIDRIDFVTPLLSKWLGTGLSLFVVTPVLSRLLALALGFDFAGRRLGGFLVDRLLRMANRDRRWPSSLIPVVSKEIIIFGDNGRERVIKVSSLETLSYVARVKPLGLFCSLTLRVYFG